MLSRRGTILPRRGAILLWRRKVLPRRGMIPPRRRIHLAPRRAILCRIWCPCGQILCDNNNRYTFGTKCKVTRNEVPCGADSAPATLWSLTFVFMDAKTTARRDDLCVAVLHAFRRSGAQYEGGVKRKHSSMGKSLTRVKYPPGSSATTTMVDKTKRSYQYDPETGPTYHDSRKEARRVVDKDPNAP